MSKYDCNMMRLALMKYDFTDCGPGDIYILDEDPTFDDKTEVIDSIKKRLSQYPNKKFQIVYVVVGHGMQDSQRRQVIPLNEFNERTRYYKMWPIENDIREIAEEYPNSHQTAFFSCGRTILDLSSHSGGFKTKEQAEQFYFFKEEDEIMATLAAMAAQQVQNYGASRNEDPAKKAAIRSVHTKR